MSKKTLIQCSGIPSDYEKNLKAWGNIVRTQATSCNSPGLKLLLLCLAFEIIGKSLFVEEYQNRCKKEDPNYDSAADKKLDKKLKKFGHDLKKIFDEVKRIKKIDHKNTASIKATLSKVKHLYQGKQIQYAKPQFLAEMLNGGTQIKELAREMEDILVFVAIYIPVVIVG